VKRTTCLLLVGLSPGYTQIRFEEIAQQAGIHFQLNNGARGQFHQVELMLGGVAVFDFDNDGCLDIYFTNGAALPSLRKTGPEFSNRLYKNNCNLTFTDVTEKAGVAGDGYSMAVATADYDNDGYTDIFVAGVNRNILYRNRGNGTFEDVTQKAGLAGIHPPYGKMWAVSSGWTVESGTRTCPCPRATLTPAKLIATTTNRAAILFFIVVPTFPDPTGLK
jgi:enediyne biosynthesis protein E4